MFCHFIALNKYSRFKYQHSFTELCEKLFEKHFHFELKYYVRYYEN
jgi:hypothetical protein